MDAAALPRISSAPPLVNRWLASPIIAAALVAFGIAYRVREYLFCNSFWYDEAFLLLPVRSRDYLDLLGPQPYRLVSPPLFLWIVRALTDLGGQGELLMRLPSFLAGITAL